MKVVISVKEDVVIYNITHQQIAIQIEDELRKILTSIPALSKVVVTAEGQVAGNIRYDIEASVEIGAKEKLTIICDVISKGEPQYIRSAAGQLMKIKEKLMKNSAAAYYPVIAAPYISPVSSRICEEMGIGYIDLSGNCMLIYKGIYVRIEGKLNKYKDARGNKSVFERGSIKSSVILRYLLRDPQKRWRVQELAEASESSIGLVSRVKSYLEEREYALSTEDGFFIKKPAEVIAEWAKTYNAKPNTVYDCYSTDSIAQLEQKLVAMQAESGIDYAFTGFSGGVRYAPTVRYNKIHVYVPLQNLQEAIAAMQCKKVTSGANISIIVPYDPCTMIDARIINGSRVASPVQVCLDLLGLAGRGEEAANAIMEKEFADER